MAQPFLLDCDTGVDDSMAILYLLSDANADVVAITNTFGNVAVEQTTVNTLGLLTLLGRTEIPVATGAQSIPSKENSTVVRRMCTAPTASAVSRYPRQEPRR